jgi:hypothetical protein
MRRASLGAILLLLAARAFAQQPFATDDAEVTEKGHWHFQYANEYDRLHDNAYPNERQNTNNFVIQYGLFSTVEVNMDFPLIWIGNASGPGVSNAFGLGDVDFAAKWKIVSEAPGESHPAFTVNGALEFPTGSESKGLGSGVTDFVLNTILQKTFSRTQLHFNAGVQFTGNTATGAVGIHTPGRILIGGLSAAHDFSGRLRLGLDLNGAEIYDGGPTEKQLQLTAGGNYGLTSNDTLDFAVIVGWYRAPRFGLLLGVSLTP